jgi:hypothetical protein
VGREGGWGEEEEGLPSVLGASDPSIVVVDSARESRASCTTRQANEICRPCPLRGSLGHTRRDKRAGRDTRQGSEHGEAVHETLGQLRAELCSNPEDSCKLLSTFVLLNAAQIRHRRRGKRQKLPQRTPRADLAFLTYGTMTKEGPISWTTALMALIRTSGAGELGHAESPCRAQIVVTTRKLNVSNLLEFGWMYEYFLPIRGQILKAHVLLDGDNVRVDCSV